MIEDKTCIEPKQDFLYILLVETNKYTGNFERELCAYATGKYGDCEVGREEAKQAEAEIKHFEWWDNNIVALPDEHGCHRPVSIWRGANEKARSYETLAIFMWQQPPQEVLDEFLQRAKNFKNITSERMKVLKCNQGVEIKGIQVIKRTTTIQDEVVA